MSDIYNEVPEPPAGVYRFIEKMKFTASPANEQRSRTRHAVATVVIATPMDEAGNPTGKPFKAVTRDLSTAGLSFLHTRTVGAKYLAIEIANGGGPAIKARLRVIRCQSLGQFYSIAGCFFAD